MSTIGHSPNMRAMRPPLGLLVGVAAALAAAGCEGGAEFGQLSVRLTDAPASNVASATVWMSRVYLVGTGEQPFTISDAKQQFDLLQLQNGVTAELGSASIPVGDYEQLRLVVESAEVTLAAGMTFADGSSTKMVKVPSGAQSGIKVNFGGPVHIHPGQTIIVVDFDVSRNFVFTGDRNHPNSVLFTPLLHATAMDVAGSIAGTSSPASANGHLFAILSTPTGPDTVTSVLADPASGAYKLWFLPSGSYTVADSAVGYVTATQSVTLGPAENVTGVNFVLTPR